MSLNRVEPSKKYGELQSHLHSDMASCSDKTNFASACYKKLKSVMLYSHMMEKKPQKKIKNNIW